MLFSAHTSVMASGFGISRVTPDGVFKSGFFIRPIFGKQTKWICRNLEFLLELLSFFLLSFEGMFENFKNSMFLLFLVPIQ